MFGLKRLLRVLAPLAVVGGALLAASCGGSNNSATTPVVYPTSGAVDYTVGTSAQQLALAVVAGGGYATLNYTGLSVVASPTASPSGGLIISATSAVSAPSNAPLPLSAHRATLSRANAMGVLYVTVSANGNIPISSIGSETLTLAPGNPVNYPYFVEIDDLTSGAYINTYPGSSINNGVVTFVNTNGFKPNNVVPAALFGSDLYLYQFYYLTNGQAPATASPSPSANPSGAASAAATPVAVSTTVPLGSSSASLPVTSGGYVATLGALAGSGGSVTITGVAPLPAGISGVVTNATSTNNTYPFYTLGFSAPSTTAFGSPAVTLQVPATFGAGLSSYPLYGALCVAGACPVSASAIAAASFTTTGGIEQVTLPAGALSGFTTVGSSPQYIVFYADRSGSTVNTSVSATVPAGGSATLNVPYVPSTPAPGGTPGPGPTPINSTVTVGGLSATTTFTVVPQTTLFTEMTAIVPNDENVFYVLKLSANPPVTTSAFGCGSANCPSTVTVNVPPALVSALAMQSPSPQFYAEPCSASACPLVPAGGTTPVPATQLTPANDQLTLAPSNFGSAITSFSNSVYLVFFYK